MSKIFKAILWGVAVIVAILLLASMSINLYLQSQGVQRRISQAASHAIGRQVAIQSTSYTPWSGIVLGKVTVSNAENANKSSSPPLLEISKVRFRILWMPLLFHRKVIPSSVQIESPVIILCQPDTNNFSVPNSPSSSVTSVKSQSAPSAPPGISSSHPGTASTSPSSGTNPSPSLARSQATSAPLSATSLPATLPKIVISDGKLLLISKQGSHTVVADGIAAQLNPTTPPGHLAGPMTCQQVTLANALFFKDLRASISYSAHTFEANPIVGSLADGKVQGEFRYQSGPYSTFEAKVNGSNISLATLLKQAGYNAGGSSGFLRGDMWIFANKGEPEGRGTVQLLQGQLEPADFLRQLGRILQIQELELLHLKNAISSFRIQKERLVFDNIFLESENLILKGTGPVRFDGHLNISAQLLFNNRLYAQYQKLMGKTLPPSSISGYHEVAFHVSGQTSRPHANLLEKLTGIRIRGKMEGFLQQLMGWPKN